MPLKNLRSKRLQVLRQVGVALSVLLVIILCWAYYPVLTVDKDLTFKWEGLLPSKRNFRDAGASINRCVGREVVLENRLFRTGRLSSGWSCDSVGNPDEIFSLDAHGSDSQKFYCRSDAGVKIGQNFQTVQLNDLEFLETWDTKPKMVEAACKNFLAAKKALDQGSRVLIQCDAGRDRTGTMTALLMAYQIEENSELNDVLIEGLECDYRKSESLKAYKYGRITKFINEIKARYGSVRAFIATECY